MAICLDFYLVARLVLGAGWVAWLAGGLLLVFIGLSCFINCLQYRQMMRAEGPWGFQEEDSADYSASLYGSATATHTRRQSRFSRGSAARAKKRAREEQAEQAKIDHILAKVSAHGMHSLTWGEKRALHKATERQRKRDLETGRTRHGG